MSSYRDSNGSIFHDKNITNELRSRDKLKFHYDAAIKNRLFNNWSTDIASMSTNIKYSLRDIIARSISLFDNNLNSGAIITNLCDNVIGQGFKIYSNYQGEGYKAINKYLDESWEQYCDEWGSLRDIDYMLSQDIRFREMLVYGSVFTKLTPNNQSNNILPIRNQIFSVLRLDESTDTDYPLYENNPNRRYTFFGMTLDNYGNPKNYKIQGVDNPISEKFLKLHFFRQFSEQFIGLPKLTNVAKYAWALEQLLSDKIISSNVAARIALCMNDDPTSNFSKDEETDNFIWEAGSVYVGKAPQLIQADDNVKMIFETLTKHMQHIMASATGISYQAMTKDLEKASMASARVNVNSDRRTYKKLQTLFLKNVIKWDRRNFIDYMFLSGNMYREFGIKYEYYKANYWKFNKCIYQAPGFEFIDPKNEAIAITTMYDKAFATHKRFFSGQGLNSEEELDQWRREQEELNIKNTEGGTQDAEEDEDGEDIQDAEEDEDI